MSPLAIGGICLVVGFLLFWLGKLPKIQVILGFVGTCIVTGGLFGHAVNRVMVFLSNATDGVANKVLGVGIPGLLVIVLGIIVIHDMHPKNKASRRTFFAGLALAACLVAGVSSFSTLNNVPTGVRNGVDNASTIG
jgi:hypothetical protein